MATGNRDNPKQRRFRWWLIPLLLVPFAAGALIHWLQKPLPPPVVSLSLVSFKVNLTNTYAVMSLSNLGPTRIFFEDRDWRAECITLDGPTTNYGSGWKSLWDIGRGSNALFRVEIPYGASSLRLNATYYYFRRGQHIFEAREWLSHKGSGNTRFSDAAKLIEPALDFLPGASLRKNVASTGWLTNLPPSSIPSE